MLMRTKSKYLHRNLLMDLECHYILLYHYHIEIIQINICNEYYVNITCCDAACSVSIESKDEILSLESLP